MTVPVRRIECDLNGFQSIPYVNGHFDILYSYNVSFAVQYTFVLCKCKKLQVYSVLLSKAAGNNNNIAFILRKFHVYNMFKCALHDTYNYTLNILRVLFGAFSCHSRNTGASPFSFTISVLGSFTCITQHTGPTALRPIRRTKQLWLSVLLKDTSVTTGTRTHTLLLTPELESGKLDRSATTPHTVVSGVTCVPQPQSVLVHVHVCK